MRAPRFAGTPTHNRPGMYAELVANVGPQVDEFLTVAHGAEAEGYATGVVLPFREAKPNLAIMWNLIIDEAARLANGQPHYVAILNDDTLVAEDWFDRMVEAIEREGSAGASTPRAPGKARSIFGGGFVVKGGLGIRMSGVTRWWYTDDEIQKLCQARGGFTIVSGVHAVNRLADQATKVRADLRAINSEDWPRFKARYGMPESPWANTEYHVVISAPEGHAQPIIDTLGDRPYVVMSEGWETDQLAAAAAQFARFVYVKESATLLPGFWEAIDSEPGSAWLFARPSCYMGIYDDATLRTMLRKLPPTRSKQDSILNEARIHTTVNWRSIWPDISDTNPLRLDVVDGHTELVIGNRLIEKRKGTARCGICAQSRDPGVCEHLLALAAAS